MAQASACPPRYLDAHAFASSHLVPLDGEEFSKKAKKWHREAASLHEEAEGNFGGCLPGFSTINSWSGLTLAPVEFNRQGWGHLKVKTTLRTKQVDELRDAIRSSSHRNALVVGGGNDYKWFIVSKGRPCPFTKNGWGVWKDLKIEEKIKFSPKRHIVLDIFGVKEMKKKIKTFCDDLENLFVDSSFEHVFVSSILERRSRELEHLEVYFAHINHFLQNQVTRMNVEDGKGSVPNVQGVRIKFHFINVSGQFFSTSEDKIVGLFRSGERGTGNLTHRDMPALEDLCHTYVKEMASVLNKS